MAKRGPKRSRPIRSFGKWIEFLRLERGWDRERLAEEAGVDPVTIHRVEIGSSYSSATLNKIANAFFPGQTWSDICPIDRIEPALINFLLSLSPEEKANFKRMLLLAKKYGERAEDA